MSEDRLPNFEMKLGPNVYRAGVTASAVAKDNVSGAMRAAVDVTYAGGQKRAVATFTLKGQIGRHTKGQRPSGPNKINLPSASGIGEAVYYVSFPHTGRKWRILGAFAEAEKNGLPVLSSLPQRFGNSALTGLGQCEAVLKVQFYVPRQRAASLGYDASSPNAEGWELVGEAEIPASAIDSELESALESAEASLTPAAG